MWSLLVLLARAESGPEMMMTKNEEGELTVRLLVYVAILFAGVFTIRATSTLVQGALGDRGLLVWSAFLIIGSLSSISGKIFNNWLGELVGLPMLWTAIGLYGWIFYSTGSNMTNHVALSCLFMALALTLFSRWQSVLDIVTARKGAR